jgi:hypothetical protein
MPQICLDVLDVIRFLALDTGNVRLSQVQRKKVKFTVFKSKRILKQNQFYQEEKRK